MLQFKDDNDFYDFYASLFFDLLRASVTDATKTSSVVE